MKTLVFGVCLIMAFVVGVAVGVIGVAYGEMKDEAPAPWLDDD